MFRTSLKPKSSPICHYLREIKKVCALPFFLSLQAKCNAPEKKPLWTTSHIVKMTSSKLLLILTDNYNTYLKMYRSRTSVDWFLTFTVEKKNTTIYSDYSYVIN